MARTDEEAIKQALLHRRDFVSQASLGKDCGIKYRSTVKRILDRLDAAGYPLEWDEHKQVRLNRTKFL